MKRYPVVTYALIAMSIIVALISNFGSSRSILYTLQIVDLRLGASPEIWKTEFWRLLTPIFIHFGILHLLFNMTYLLDIGSLLESKRGSLYFGVLVLVIGIFSNLAQYGITGSPFFGGMSGVLYGLFGYVWMQGRYNRYFGVALSQSTVTIMLGWFFLCWTGLLGPIANWTHTAGLVLGLIWGRFAR